MAVGAAASAVRRVKSVDPIVFARTSIIMIAMGVSPPKSHRPPPHRDRGRSNPSFLRERETPTIRATDQRRPEIPK
jgi:hypothetical protein